MLFPNLSARDGTRLETRTFAGLGLLLLLSSGLVASCSSFKEVKLLTVPQEMAVGELFSQSVEQQYPILKDPVIEWYLNTRGRQMAEVAGGLDFPYQFKVINTWELNAFALPGGHIFINLGMIGEADTEGELLGVMAHEIGHVVARHGNERMSQGALIGIAGTVAFNEYYNQWAYLSANLFTQASFLKLGRDAERESDGYGVKILYDYGYDPAEMAGMFEKMLEKQKRQPGRFEKLWLTHPPTPQRIENIKEAVAALKIDTSSMKKTSPEFEMMKEWLNDHYPKPKSIKDDEDEDGDIQESPDDGEQGPRNQDADADGRDEAGSLGQGIAQSAFNASTRGARP